MTFYSTNAAISQLADSTQDNIFPKRLVAEVNHNLTLLVATTQSNVSDISEQFEGTDSNISHITPQLYWQPMMMSANR